jgi:hypothetical protein
VAVEAKRREAQGQGAAHGIKLPRLVVKGVGRVLFLKEDSEYEVVLNSSIRLGLSRRFRKKLQDRLGIGARGAGA